MSELVPVKGIPYTFVNSQYASDTLMSFYAETEDALRGKDVDKAISLIKSYRNFQLGGLAFGLLFPSVFFVCLFGAAFSWSLVLSIGIVGSLYALLLGVFGFHLHKDMKKINQFKPLYDKVVNEPMRRIEGQVNHLKSSPAWNDPNTQLDRPDLDKVVEDANTLAISVQKKISAYKVWNDDQVREIVDFVQLEKMAEELDKIVAEVDRVDATWEALSLSESKKSPVLVSSTERVRMAVEQNRQLADQMELKEGKPDE